MKVRCCSKNLFCNSLRFCYLASIRILFMRPNPEKSINVSVVVALPFWILNKCFLLMHILKFLNMTNWGTWNGVSCSTELNSLQLLRNVWRVLVDLLILVTLFPLIFVKYILLYILVVPKCEFIDLSACFKEHSWELREMINANKYNKKNNCRWYLAIYLVLVSIDSTINR